MLEYLNFIFSALIPVLITFIGSLHYKKYRDLNRIDDLLEKIKKSSEDNMLMTKKYLEKEKCNLIKFIITGRRKEKEQNKFYQIHNKCNGIFSNRLIRIYMQYTTLSKDNKLEFNFFPFIWKSALADILMIFTTFVILRYFLPCEIEYLYIILKLFYSLVIAFIIIGSFAYYIVLLFTFKKYKKMISS